MQHWRIEFAFYSMMVVIIFCNATLSYSQAKTIPSQRQLDSINYDYSLSNKDSIPLLQRLYYVSSFLDGAYRYQKDILDV